MAALPAIKARREQPSSLDFQRIGTVNAMTWDATRARLDKEWSDLKAAVDKAN